ncbi:hypothetical protein FOA43_001650 [Brettanomyces nanus]|uniref:FCP1 homology domain-containing protein n=1 Tax=Eeniella nana TaxID=13502 RepID=A0A875S092_EENNA|nr:uncharacterized protein FOA43_001650 [Brettanomyces nanus]QPG74323.1 hypothetical protein FOA43_001650 [Brettanomyces nanus]
MSFLSSLFCCFDTQDPETHEGNITTRHKAHLTSTQSNLQKALNNKLSKQPNNNKLSYEYSDVDVDVDEDEDGKINNHKQVYKSSNKSKNKLQKPLRNYGTTKQLAKHSDMDINVVQSKNMNHTDSTSSRDEVCELKSQNVHEVTDAKDSTDSSKDDDVLAEQLKHHQIDTEGHQQQAEPLPKPPQQSVRLEPQKQPSPQKEPDGDTFMTDADRSPFSPASETKVEQGGVDNSDGMFEDEDEDDEALYREEETSEEPQFDLDLTKILSDQVVAKSGWLLDNQPFKLKGRKTLVLDLDETLVHSSFKYVRHCDFVIPVEIENQVHNVYVIKRPGVDEFLKRCGQIFEVVVFTASVARYGDPLLDILDTHHSVHQRLFRESCYNYQGNYIKNLSQLGRPLEDVIIIDNSPASYIFHPQHSVPISSWFSDTHDCELTDLLPLLTDLAGKEVDDVRLVLDVNI